MPRIRPSQINDLTLRYNSYAVGAVSGSSVAVTGSAYTAFLAATRTGAIGGTAASVSGFVTGTAAEPFIGIVPGDSFTIRVADFIGGNPVTVTFQSGDFVTLNGVLTTTAARVAARVNAAMTLAGAAFPCCSGTDGVLQFRSVNNVGYTTGAETSIVLTEVTPSVLQRLGLGPVSTVTGAGVKGPKRGVVTVSPDGLGTHVPLKTSNLEELSTRTSSLYHAGNRALVPDNPGGFPVFGRVAPMTGGVRLTFLAKVKSRPVARSRFSDFSTLTSGETISIQVQDPASGLNVTVPVTVASAITTTQQVTDLINLSWQNATAAAGSPAAGARQAVVTGRMSEPFSLMGCQMSLAFNGLSPVSVAFTGERSASEVVTTINNVIAGAGQSAEGLARVYTDSGGRKFVELASSLVAGPASIITLTQASFAPGAPTLERLGLPPTLIRGWDLARTVGAEVHVVNPGRDGSLAITGGSTTLGKFGLTGYSSVIGAVVDDLYPNTSSTYLALIPEMQDVSDVSDLYEESVQKFIDLDPYPPPADGPFPSNAGLSVTASPDGQIHPGVLPKAYEFLSVDDLTLGARRLASPAEAGRPRQVAPFRIGAGIYTLMEESPSLVVGTSSFRRYMRGDGVWVQTVNAKWDAAASLWSKDVDSALSTRVEMKDDGMFLSRRAAGVGTWNDASWTAHSFSSELGGSTGAGSIGITTSALWADGSAPAGTEVQTKVNNVIGNLGSTVSADSGAEKIGHQAVSGSPLQLYPNSVSTHIQEILAAVNQPFNVEVINNDYDIDGNGQRNSVVIIADNQLGAGPYVVQLPLPSLSAGRRMYFINSAPMVDGWILTRAGSEKINNVNSSYTMHSVYPSTSWTVTCDGTNWHVVEVSENGITGSARAGSPYSVPQGTLSSQIQNVLNRLNTHAPGSDHDGYNDGRYSNVSHNHNGVYSPVGHAHGYADRLWHFEYDMTPGGAGAFYISAGVQSYADLIVGYVVHYVSGTEVYQRSVGSRPNNLIECWQEKSKGANNGLVTAIVQRDNLFRFIVCIDGYTS